MTQVPYMTIHQRANGTYYSTVLPNENQTMKGQDYLSLLYLAERSFFQGKCDLEDFYAIANYAASKKSQPTKEELEDYEAEARSVCYEEVL